MADKKLFGQAEDNNPPLDDKIAFGTDTNNARNMTFTNFLAWLESKLGFFKVSNNLSEANAGTVRTNLNVMSATDVLYFLGLKANRTDVLEKGNTTVFNPTMSYDPATKKYVDDQLLAGALVSDKGSGFSYDQFGGRLTITATRIGNGHYRITHNLFSLNYFVLAQAVPRDGATDILVSTYEPFPAYFDVRTIKDNAAFDGCFVFEMKPANY